MKSLIDIKILILILIDINQYFDFLGETLKDIPPENIFNIDETNLTDDTGKKRVIAQKGQKYVCNIQNTTKTSISLMFGGSASGVLLPPYVVYKSMRSMFDVWTRGGPVGTPC